MLRRCIVYIQIAVPSTYTISNNNNINLNLISSISDSDVVKEFSWLFMLEFTKPFLLCTKTLVGVDVDIAQLDFQKLILKTTVTGNTRRTINGKQKRLTRRRRNNDQSV